MPDNSTSTSQPARPDVFTRLRRLTARQPAGMAVAGAPHSAPVHAASESTVHSAAAGRDGAEQGATAAAGAAQPPGTPVRAEAGAVAVSSLFQRMARLQEGARRASPVAAPATRSGAAPAGSGGAPSTSSLPAQAPAAAGVAAGRAGQSAGGGGRGSLLSRLLTIAPSEGDAPPPSGISDAGDDGAGASTAGAAAATETVRGLVERTQIYNGNWGIAHIWTEDRQSVKVTGEVVGDLKDGLTYEFQGNFRNSQHGESFVAVSAKTHLECDRRAIVRFISKSFKGVGERLADKFVTARVEAGVQAQRSEAEVLEEIRRTLVSAPWTLDLSEVTRKGQFDGDNSELMTEAVKRDLATRIGRYDGIKEPVLKSMASWLLTQEMLRRGAAGAGPRAPGISPDLVDKCWAILATNPYGPIGNVAGYGFKTADAIGRTLNIPRDAPQRLAALASYAIGNTCSRAGHMFLAEEQARQAVREVDPMVDADAVLKAGLEQECIVQDSRPAGSAQVTTVYYDQSLHDTEHMLARRLSKALGDRCKPLAKEPEQQLRAKLQAIAKRLNPNLANGLDDSQLTALVGILTARCRVHTITAGPGCGKTSIMEVLTAFLGAERFDFCAPTGRAALVLGNRLAEVGGSASTIHSLFRGNGAEFQVNEDNPLSSDILVVDEGSMPPASLWNAMLAGMAEGQHIIVLGDVGQLPSIEPGRVLDDLLQMPAVDKHRLTASHRAAGGLLEILAQIDRGTIDCKDRPDVKFSHGLPPAEVGFEAVAQEYVEAVGQYGYPQVALLMSRRKGDVAKPDWNVTYANGRLRELCNPNAPKVPGTRFHIGDRVIFRENLKVPRGGTDPEADDSDDPLASNRVTVVNGDTGTLKDFTKGKGNLAGAKWLRVTLDDGRDVQYPVDASIDHAYAITVHSAQGGEYRHVVAVVTPGQASFVNQVMLRTQLSRARQFMKVHADDAALRRVAATPMPPRNSRLVELVKHYGETPSGDDPVEEEGACAERCPQ